MDVGALVGGAVALVVGLLSWGQSRATNRREDFREITARLDRELAHEKKQRKLLTSYVIDLWKWAQRVGPDTPAGPPPEPDKELDLTPWHL
ncbi:phage holin family protein [Streptomyces cadmiisoli]|uniref:hypothetical protein n=1 Tax=Streptomyces cadmiisoli TaxID=2184053 RepID=UPI00366A355E